MAHGMGADYIEQDVLLSRDGELIVLHDLFLDAVTDVAQRYPGRQREDGHYYAIDFDLAEIRTLRVNERRKKNGKTRRSSIMTTKHQNIRPGACTWAQILDANRRFVDLYRRFGVDYCGN